MLLWVVLFFGVGSFVSPSSHAIDTSSTRGKAVSSRSVYVALTIFNMGNSIWG